MVFVSQSVKANNYAQHVCTCLLVGIRDVHHGCYNEFGIIDSVSGTPLFLSSPPPQALYASSLILRTRVLLCVMLMASSIGQITGPLSAASQAADACAIFHTIIDAPKPTYGTAKGAGVSADGDIVFENVNFTYATRPDVKVLDNLNLRIPAGKVTAIVGPSGSGKSTIVGILQRWYEFNGDMATNQLVSTYYVYFCFG
jgi:ABC-type multidrug transport system fused ATPase/permease subunit